MTVFDISPVLSFKHKKKMVNKTMDINRKKNAIKRILLRI